jgi:hypothetical protein
MSSGNAAFVPTADSFPPYGARGGATFGSWEKMIGEDSMPGDTLCGSNGTMALIIEV